MLDLLPMIALLILLAGFLWYTTLLHKKNNALQALASMDQELKKRHKLLLSIFKLDKKLLYHEKELLDDLYLLRPELIRNYDSEQIEAISQHLSNEALLEEKLTQLFSTHRSCEELNADEAGIATLELYGEIQASICLARDSYNNTVADLNRAITSFPGNFIAYWATIKGMPYFEISRAPYPEMA